MTATQRRGIYMGGLLISIPALLGGLFALEVHPLAGTLMALAGMALLLSSLSEFCQAPEVGETSLRKKPKESVYGG